MTDLLDIPPWLKREPTKAKVRTTIPKRRFVMPKGRNGHKKRKAPDQVKGLKRLNYPASRISKITRDEADQIIMRQREYQR